MYTLKYTPMVGYTGGKYEMINSRAFSHLKIILLFVWHATDIVIEWPMGHVIYKLPFFRSFKPNNDVECRFVWKYEIMLLFIFYTITIHNLC